MVTNIVNLPHTRPLIAKQNHNGRHLPKKVAILYSEVKRKYFPTHEQYLTEKDAFAEASSFIPHLTKLGIKTVLVPADSHVTNRLRRHKPNLVIDLVNSVRGCEYLSSTAPAMLELLEIPYTGASMLGFTISMNKYMTKEIMVQHGIPVPKFQLFTSWRQKLDPSMRFPVILKLNEVHGSLEITKDAIAENEVQLRKRLRFLMKIYEQDVLAEEFIEGREIAAFLFHSFNKKVYLIEKHLPNGSKNKYKIMDFNTVWNQETTAKDYYVNTLTKYHDPLLTALVKKAFEVVKMEDYGKFDIRLDRFGKYFFIDSNPNCYFAPPSESSEITTAMKMYGVPFPVLLKRLLQNTMREWGY